MAPWCLSSPHSSSTNLSSLLEEFSLLILHSFYIGPQSKQMFRFCLEKAMGPHSSTLAWKIPWTEEPGGPQSMGSLRVRHYWVTSFSLFTFMHWRRKRNPLQCSCLENPRDGGAWWAAVYGVAHRVGRDRSDLAAAAVYFWMVLICISLITMSLEVRYLLTCLLVIRIIFIL